MGGGKNGAAVLLCAVLLIGSSAQGQGSGCAGDCNGDGLVRINELVRLVGAALTLLCPIPEPEFCPRDTCLNVDVNGNGTISANELTFAIYRIVGAVGNSVGGCP